MRSLRNLITTCLLLSLVLAGIATAQVRPAEYTFAIDVNGTVCGYADVDITKAEQDGKAYMLIKQKMFVMSSALGFEINSHMDMTFHVDPTTGQFSYYDFRLQQGDMDLKSDCVIHGTTARCTPLMTGEALTLELPPGVILPGSLHMLYLRDDFVGSTIEKKTYDVLNVQEAAVHKITYTKTGAETVTLAGKTYDTIILDELNEVTGMKMTTWLDTKEGISVKVVMPNGRNIYLADDSVKKKIELANLDVTIATKTNVAIADVAGLTYMKVKARMEPTGLRLTPEDLNVPGQRFEGTVKENLIEGVFEIEHPRYDGKNAPPFPPNFRDDQSLKKFLEPEKMIESDDPVLIKKAKKLTAGSKNSWEAAKTLSEWVANNIAYEIPGGGAARKTFDLRAGECGAHSLLLAAFCRAVGIPARVVWGCMYLPNFGGSFGQHAWSEIYMGDAGWITVDSTAFETDFVDSGHIRVGIYQSFSTAINTRAMEIIDYRTGAGGSEEPSAADADQYAPYLGEYDSPRGGEPFKVRVVNGLLAVDIPNQATLPFNKPDEKGKWKCGLTANLSLTFKKDESGKVTEMTFHEMVRMRRRSDPQSVSDDVPRDLRPHLGGYYFAAVQAEFGVIWDDGKLAIRDPLANKIVHLLPTDEKGVWVDEDDKNLLSFVQDDEGKSITLLVTARNRFPKR